MAWEYKLALVAFGIPKVAEEVLNELGAQNWELVGIAVNILGPDKSWSVATFKRQCAAASNP
jgi:hypothetical protein